MGDRWSALRWFLSWCVSPVPVSWLLLGITAAFTAWGIYGLLTFGDYRAAVRQHHAIRDSLRSSAGRGLRVTLPDGTVAWLAPRDTMASTPDTVRRRR